MVRGESETPDFILTGDRVNIGHLKRVIGDRGGLYASNEIARPPVECSERSGDEVHVGEARVRFKIL